MHSIILQYVDFVLLIKAEPGTGAADRLHISFPYLNLKGMSKDEEEQLHQISGSFY